MKLFELPDLGEGLPDAIIREWYVSVGDEVKVDQPLVAMETAKALVDVPSPFHGHIEKLFGAVGDTINTHDPLVGFAGDAEASGREDSGTVVGSIEQGSTLSMDAVIKTGSSLEGGAIKVTPAVRALAKKLGVTLTEINGTGPKGSITKQDVEQAANQTAGKPQAQKQGAPGTPLSGLRRAMVLSMTASHQHVVPVTLCDDADIHTWKNQDVTVRLIRAIQAAVQAAPVVNSHFHGEALSIEYFDTVNIGIAVDTPEGLFVPVIKDVAHQTDEALRIRIETFKTQARSKSIAQEDLRGATIMLSNFGAFAGRYANPIIVPPLVCILGVGRSRDAVVPVEGQPAIHRLMPLSVTVDHRAITGGEATRFLKEVITSLENPSATRT